eukprot:257698_1
MATCLPLFLILSLYCTNAIDVLYHEYIIFGAGPAGLQMGYLMQHFDPETKYDYLIIERNNIAGNFFNKYPRHRKLLSINKVYTGNPHHEFNLRHDWNSLLTPKKTENKFTYNINTDQYKMKFANYSEEYYPDRADLAKYLSDFSNYFDLNILYNAEITNVEQDELNDDIFLIDIQISSKPQNIYDPNNDTCEITYLKYSCKHLFVATGLSKPNIPPIPGIDAATSYSDMSMDLNFYKNKKIAVLGGKNSAFEIAHWVSQVSAHTHIFPILMPRFSYETHYVGDVRSINMEFLDHYLLKSLDAITEQTILQIEINYDNETDTFQLPPKDKDVLKDLQRPWPLRGKYDIVIHATGFLFDCSIFSDEICAKLIPNPRKVRYPVITNQYTAKRVTNMHFLGGLMHSVDWKKSAGGFIHGYRYLIKTLFHQIVEKSYKNSKIKIELEEITKYFMIRMNTGSSYYQMFSVMNDVVVIRKKENDDGSVIRYAEYYYDILISQLNTLIDSKDKCSDIIAMTFDYNNEFIGHDVVLYDRDRVVQDYRKSKDAKFLHPILRYYSCKILKNKNDNSYQDYASSKYKISERHVIEDFLTLWDHEKFHVNWLAKWITKISKVEQILWRYSEQDMLDAYN